MWPLFTCLCLTENIHARSDPKFSEFLLALGNCELQTEENEVITIPSALRLPIRESLTSLDDLVKHIYPQISTACA